MTHHSCAQPGCKVNEGGPCLEGLESSQCPHIQFLEEPSPSTSDAADDDDEADLDESPVDTRIDVPFWNGDSLDELEASEVLGRSPARLIVVAGAEGSGKTTLLTALYELFLRGPIGSLCFAGSQTLPGFERRAHPSRVKSGREDPTTARTPISRAEAPSYLHLEIQSPHLGRRELLITDVAGEVFRLAADSSDQANRLRYLSRADNFTLLLDGAELCDSAKRHHLIAQARTLTRALVEGGMLSSRSLVQLVLTKLDLVEASPDAPTIREAVKRLREELSSKFENTIGTVSLLETAARPEAPSDLDFGHGLQVLLEAWVRDSRYWDYRDAASDASAFRGQKRSEFGNLRWRPVL